MSKLIKKIGCLRYLESKQGLEREDAHQTFLIRGRRNRLVPEQNEILLEWDGTICTFASNRYYWTSDKGMCGYSTENLCS